MLNHFHISKESRSIVPRIVLIGGDILLQVKLRNHAQKIYLHLNTSWIYHYLVQWTVSNRRSRWMKVRNWSIKIENSEKRFFNFPTWLALPLLWYSHEDSSEVRGEIAYIHPSQNFLTFIKVGLKKQIGGQWSGQSSQFSNDVAFSVEVSVFTTKIIYH